MPKHIYAEIFTSKYIPGEIYREDKSELVEFDLDAIFIKHNISPASYQKIIDKDQEGNNKSAWDIIGAILNEIVQYKVYSKTDEDNIEYYHCTGVVLGEKYFNPPTVVDRFIDLANTPYEKVLHSFTSEFEPKMSSYIITSDYKEDQKYCYKIYVPTSFTHNGRTCYKCLYFHRINSLDKSNTYNNKHINPRKVLRSHFIPVNVTIDQEYYRNIPEAYDITNINVFKINYSSYANKDNSLYIIDEVMKQALDGIHQWRELIATKVWGDEEEI